MEACLVAWAGLRASACSDSGRWRHPQPRTGRTRPQSNTRNRKEKPRSLSGDTVGVCSARKGEFEVHIVHSFGFGLGRISVGLARIGHVFWSSQCLQVLECGSSPTSGTADPLVRGDFALTCGH